MKISVFGLGYVGAVTCACLTEKGRHVIGVDVQQGKVDTMNRGQASILEPELADLLAAAKANGLIQATTDVDDAIAGSDVSVICVGCHSRQRCS